MCPFRPQACMQWTFKRREGENCWGCEGGEVITHPTVRAGDPYGAAPKVNDSHPPVDRAFCQTTRVSASLMGAAGGATRKGRPISPARAGFGIPVRGPRHPEAR